MFFGWLSPVRSQLDHVGCGNGAFTQILVDRCSPAEVQGIDPAEGQLAFARARSAARIAEFQKETPWRSLFRIFGSTLLSWHS